MNCIADSESRKLNSRTDEAYKLCVLFVQISWPLKAYPVGCNIQMGTLEYANGRTQGFIHDVDCL